MTDRLRTQLSQLDPMHPGVPVTSPTKERLEDIMATPTIEAPRTKRNPWYAAVAVAVVAVAVAASIPSPGSNSSPTAPPLALSLGEGDSLASCLAFDVAALAQLPMAFEGTVTSIDGDLVTLTVDHWFRGGDAATVQLSAPNGLEALIGSAGFVQGGQFLVTASEGVVNYCGFSGPSTPEFRASFEQAFSS